MSLYLKNINFLKIQPKFSVTSKDMLFFFLEMLYLWETTKIQKNHFSHNFVSIFFSFPQDKFEEFWN